jgi:type I site-specific restriction endonuclease
MEVLKMFSQDRMERELYEGRLRAKRDALTQEMALRVALEQVAEVQQHFTAAKQCAVAAEQRSVAAEQRSVESERQRIEVQQRLDEATMQRDAAVRQASKSALVGQIQLCERLLGRDGTDSADLQQRDEETLRATADRLERELARLR